MSHILLEVGQPATNHLWEMVPTLTGVLVGAFPAYLLARRSSKEIERRDAVARARAERTAARSAAFKIQRIVNSLGGVNGQITEMIRGPIEAGLPASQLWRVLKPFAGLQPELAKFDVEELAIIYDADEARLANDILLLAERQFATEMALTYYSDRRRYFADKITDGLAKGVPESETVARSTPITQELNEAASQLREIYADDFTAAKAVMERYARAMQRYFKDDRLFQLVIVEPN